MSRYSSGFPEYVSVEDRKIKNQKMIKKLEKKGRILTPIALEGRTIAVTFWGKAWCKHIEKFSDYNNRLGRGRSYLRLGSVIDFKINNGHIEALVAGTDNYKITVKLKSLSKEKWESIIKGCSGKIDSIISLLQGSFSKDIVEEMTSVEKGLFPSEKEINFKCSCYDFADMCKHVAAVLYAFGNWLDKAPEDLFKLRSVDHMDLLKTDFIDNFLNQTDNTELSGDLSDIFGIDIAPVKIKKSVKKLKKISI
jgi:uncharacterized Zn finger protein